MKTLLIKRNKFTYGNEEFELNDLFTDELYKFLDKNVEKYKSDLCIVNEVYLSRAQSFQALNLYISKNQIDFIKLDNPDKCLIPVVVDVAHSKKININGIPIFYKLSRTILSHINIIASMVYILWKMINSSKTNDATSQRENISIIRTPAAKKKMDFLNNVDKRYENLNISDTIYNCFGKLKKLSWVIKAWIASYSELKKYGYLIKAFTGSYSAIESFYYYSKRIVHTMLYSYMLDDYFRKNRGKTFYTGNNLDRFALFEDKIAQKYQLKIICIPHGLEYGFKFPHCFIGDEFYTTSIKASIHLNELYKTNKFKYDFNIAQKMFSVDYKGKKKRSIVFFTEPREVEVNLAIIDELLPLMKKNELQLSIKLHPKDKKSDYNRYADRVNFIENFQESVSHNICFSRKSTMLLESIYNGSSAAAILINSKDNAIFNTFPSLQDEKINVFYDTLDLFNWIYDQCVIKNK